MELVIVIVVLVVAGAMIPGNPKIRFFAEANVGTAARLSMRARLASIPFVHSNR